MASSIFQINQWRGLNQAADGDTGIKNGELAVMRNFRVTREGHLQTRGGTKTFLDLKTAWDTWCESHTPSVSEPELTGLWYGRVSTGNVILAAFGGVLWAIDPTTLTPTAKGTATQDKTVFFGFSENAYLLNGHEYKVWDGGSGTEFSDVTGYIPTTQTAVPPAGGGTALQAVNRLNGYRRVKFSPDGSATVFTLPEQGIDEIVSVSGTSITYTPNLTNGTLTFASAPGTGVNTIQVVYRKGTGARSEVTGMHYCELFNGPTDSRVFLYGDGTNRSVYSGLTVDGEATAEYFPDLYELRAGDDNTPITSMCRHYNRLLCFKVGSAWSIQYGTITLEDDTTTAAFYVTPINRQYGNEAPGQVHLLMNDAVSLDGNAAYLWKATSTSGNYSDTERNCSRLSDNVTSALSGFDFTKTACFNYQYAHEYFIVFGSSALVYNYGNKAWYLYTAFPAAFLFSKDGILYFGTTDGKLKEYSRSYRNDDGTAIDCYAETGSMDFGANWRQKYETILWVSIKPESGARVTVTAESNRRSDYPDKVVASSLATFSRANFAHWSFGTNRKPQVERIKLKVKKATFIKLIFKSNSASATATILSVDDNIRFGGNVK